jgi:hypothetical protein
MKKTSIVEARSGQPRMDRYPLGRQQPGHQTSAQSVPNLVEFDRMAFDFTCYLLISIDLKRLRR